MISLERLLDTIAAEAVESMHEARMNDPSYQREETHDYPRITYRLELIKEDDGTYFWAQ